MKRLDLAIVIWGLVTAVGLLAPQSTHSPAQRFPEWISDAAHFVLFLVMVVLVALRLYGIRSSRPVLLAMVLAFAYGFLLELAQIPVPGRYVDPKDLALNGLGCLVGGGVVGRARKRPLD